MQCLKNSLGQLRMAQGTSYPVSGQILKVIGSTCVMASKRCKGDLYSVETCEDCVSAYKIPSAKKGLKKIPAPDPFKNKDPCWQSMRRTEYKCRTDPEFMLDSFIEYKKKCLPDPCAFDVPRADLKLYKPSDKLKRKYQRTWLKCVIKKRPIKLRYYCKPIQYRRRKHKLVEIKTSSCQRKEAHPGAPKLDLFKCIPIKKSDCPRMTMPFCKANRFPPRCKGARKPRNCRKRLTKYPSFSECLMDPLPEAPRIECNCLMRPSMCEVWEYFRNKKS